jgi:hypothetical protein
MAAKHLRNPSNTPRSVYIIAGYAFAEALFSDDQSGVSDLPAAYRANLIGG